MRIAIFDSVNENEKSFPKVKLRADKKDLLGLLVTGRNDPYLRKF